MKQWAIRYLSYPLVFGAAAAAILWAATHGLPYWPTIPLMALAAIACVALLERWQPYEKAWLADHGDTATDSLHFLLNASVLYGSIEILSWARGLLPALAAWPMHWPVWMQVGAAMIVLDFGLFFMHWLSHRHYRLWLFHEAHHSSERLYWLNSERRHPLHAMMMGAPGLAVLLVLGAPAATIASGLAILSVHLAFQHANLDYSLGPLRHAFGVAQTHRWHHKRDYADAQVNFGEWLMLWDHLFRTYRQPPGRIGRDDVGLDSPDAPATYHRQLLRPFL
ncbi:sterol desaturase family protein [Duganella sp. Root198D2]|uniref:sterol desaturase family protein n=1 Tax=Duganella sp. Root198D2 TaxID=1736489 RepID=UPI0007101D12|nr:sterol desaturase family protein [Duganella sp. Root198D2]KRB84239.1 sterol desaturase [Duganella sp. Root198D2]